MKSDLWVSKKSVSGVFKLIYEKSFTMNIIIEGFRKCGIYPFNPNAIDKDLLLRSCQDITADNIDLDKQSEEVDKDDNDAAEEIPSVSSTVATSEEGVLDESVFDMAGLGDISFTVGDDGILTLETQTLANQEDSPSADSCPTELALMAVESSLTPRKKRRFEECLGCDVDLDRDVLFQRWKSLKLQVMDNVTTADGVTTPSAGTLSTPSNGVSTAAPACISNTSNGPCTASKDMTTTHPLVKAGLISPSLVEVLVVPSLTKPEKKKQRAAKVLTSDEVVKELEEKERLKKEKEEEKKRRSQEREEKKILRLIAQAKKQEEIKARKEAREKQKQEKIIEKQRRKENKAAKRCV